MPVDTKIEGNPESLRGAANWLRGSLKSAIKGATDKVYGARNDAEGGLRGEAADALHAKLATGGKQADDFEQTIAQAAQQADAAADVMQQVQQDMQRIRTEASNAGLQITGEVIQDPGPGPSAPGPAPTGDAAVPDAVNQHNAAVQAQQVHQAKVAAFNKARTDSEDVHRKWAQQVQQRREEWNNTKNKTKFTVAGFGVTGGVEATKAAHTSILKKDYKALEMRAAQSEAHAREMIKAGPKGMDAKAVYDNIDSAKTDRAAAEKIKTEGLSKAGKVASRVSNVGGGVLAAGGVAYDIANGKPVTQAVTSGAAGFGASVAAGAGIGTFVGGPVGTALGAVGGAAVGAFTSGAVDSMFKNGVGDVGTAVADGAKAVGDTGAAVGSLAKDAGEGIASGVKDVWNSVF